MGRRLFGGPVDQQPGPQPVGAECVELAPAAVADIGRRGVETLIADRVEQAGQACDQPLAARTGFGKHPPEQVDHPVTSTIAYSTIFGALFDIGRVPAIILGGGVVIIYSTLGGMWSITLTDFVQFIVKTIGIFFILLPLALYKTGGMSGLAEKLPADATR